MTEDQTIRVLVIDDEDSSHKRLAALFEANYPQVELLDSGYNITTGFELIEKYKPDLVFLDIEMPDGTGFDLLKKIGKPDFHVIFITGHNKYAVTAFQFGAIHYLLKPIDEEELEKAFQKVRKEFQHRVTQDQLSILWETLGKYNNRELPKRIAITTSEGIHYKEFKNIIRLEAQKSYTAFSFTNGSQLIASVNLGEFIDQFEHYKEFMKVHRSHLINLHYVDRFVKAEGGYLVMEDGAKVSVSKLYRDDLFERLRYL